MSTCDLSKRRTCLIALSCHYDCLEQMNSCLWSNDDPLDGALSAALEPSCHAQDKEFSAVPAHTVFILTSLHFTLCHSLHPWEKLSIECMASMSCMHNRTLPFLDNAKGATKASSRKSTPKRQASVGCRRCLKHHRCWAWQGQAQGFEGLPAQAAPPSCHRRGGGASTQCSP